MITIDGVKLYDTQELATMLNVNRSTISKLRVRGQIKFTRIGRRLYTSEGALRLYLNGRVAETISKSDQPEPK